MEAFKPIVMPDAHVPQLAIDHVVRKLTCDPQAFALDYLNLQHTVKVLHERREQEVRAINRTEALDAIRQQIKDACARLDRAEDRLDGRRGEKSIEGLRESVGGLIGRECV